MLRRCTSSVIGRGLFGTAFRRLSSSKESTIWLVPLQFDKGREETPKSYVPPRNSTKHTLVIDLDGTLVDTASLSKTMHVTFLRPYVIPFLREMHELFEVIYWTAGVEFYGRSVLKAIEAAGRKFDGKSVCGENPLALYRQHTLEEKGYMKYIPFLKRPVQNVLMIDDRARSFRLTPRQAILVEEWWVDPMAIPDLRKADYKKVLQVLRRKEPIDFEHLPVVPELGDSAIQDSHLEDMRKMLRRCAKSENPSREMDFYRPDGYHRTDNFLRKVQLPRKHVLGAWLPQRRKKPVPLLRRRKKKN